MGNPPSPDYTVVWDGKTSLHDLTHDVHAQHLGWRQVRNVVLAGAPGRDGIPSYREMNPSFKHHPRKTAVK